MLSLLNRFACCRSLDDVPCDSIPCATVLRTASVMYGDCRAIIPCIAVSSAALPLSSHILLFCALPPATMLSDA